MLTHQSDSLPHLRGAAPPVSRAGASLAARIAIVVAAALVIGEAVSVVARGAIGFSDIGVFYRTCVLLRDGVRDIYPRADSFTGWPISMPPLGFAIFQPFSPFGPRGSAIGWAAFNIILLGVSLMVLRRVLGRTGDQRYERTYAWAAALLLALGAASIQVGQFSVLFVTCWLLSLDAFGRGRIAQSACWLALPAAVKIYPIGIAAAPLSVYLVSGINRPGRTFGASARYLVWLALAVPLLWFAVPAIPYGRDTFSLNASWWHGVILNNAQMDYLQSLRAISNQSLDTILLRFLSYDPAFHDHYPQIPHLALAKTTVLHLAHVMRLAIIAISGVAVLVRARRRLAAPETSAAAFGTDILVTAALWLAVLYNILPETKARYAIYMFVAMLPWLACAVDPARTRRERILFGTSVFIATVLTLVLLPDVLQAWGVGFIGPFVIWIGNLRFVARDGHFTATSAA